MSNTVSVASHKRFSSEEMRALIYYCLISANAVILISGA